MADIGKSNLGTRFSANGDGDTIDPNVARLISENLQDYLAQCDYHWESNLAPYMGAGNNCISPKVSGALRALADEFTSMYKDQFVEMCEKLSISAETLKRTLDGVANELFCEGIKWTRIVALFVFGRELALHCKNRNWPDLINIIAYSLASYVSEKLLPWINDHGGWEGLAHFSEGVGNAPDKDKWPSLRNIICLGVSALGAITLGAVLAKS